MTLLSSPPSPLCISSSSSSSFISKLSFFSSDSFSCLKTKPSVPSTSSCFLNPSSIKISNLFTNQQQTITLHNSKFRVSEGTSHDELWAAASLRVRTFNQLPPDSFGIHDHKKYLAEHEFEAMKERIAGKRVGFKRVSCINATLPLSEISTLAEDLCSTCKFSDNGEDRVVVGSLDINQCVRLPDEITGMKPEGIGADFARAYLSNVCVAKELQRNGLGYALIAKAKTIALDWGISDLYVHVAFNNEGGKKLYMKSGFVYESDEPSWQARFLDRPRRILFWTPLSQFPL
ncbi:uncharacterized protein LOC101206225 [Cucumis sativus]|uniref:N-acetyltransferase domain-containing protein n=1 Tax=Cucumis sativus TaxID=3659 RepID=A0A0A0K1B5_CUCSA|nr:uncharacterized protein LOC101206225 [Cucumis sativus]KGN43258.1 hypothetical protein Csa_020292 [Cucumis sativus]